MSSFVDEGEYAEAVAEVCKREAVARDSVRKAIALARVHDPETGYFRRVCPYELYNVLLPALRAMAKPELCKCTLRERLVGDGCLECNPEFAADL